MHSTEKDASATATGRDLSHPGRFDNLARGGRGRTETGQVRVRVENNIKHCKRDWDTCKATSLVGVDSPGSFVSGCATGGGLVSTNLCSPC